MAAQQHSQSDKPNFTGRWQLNLERSKLQIPAPASSLFVIEHQEPKSRLTRTHVYGDRSDTITFELTTDGSEHELHFGGLRALARLFWKGSTLKADMKVKVPDDEGTNVVWYWLEDGGRTFVAKERWRSAKHNHDNLWMSDRQ